MYSLTFFFYLNFPSIDNYNVTSGFLNSCFNIEYISKIHIRVFSKQRREHKFDHEIRRLKTTVVTAKNLNDTNLSINYISC